MEWSPTGIRKKHRAESISDRLAAGVSEFKDTPWWKTAIKTIAPYALSYFMGPAGKYLGKLAGATSGAGGTILDFFSKGLTQTGAAGTGALGALKTASQAGVKGLYHFLTGGATQKALDILDPKSPSDINLEGLTPLEQVEGAKAVGKIRRDIDKAKEIDWNKRLTSSIISGFVQQGDPAKILQGLKTPPPKGTVHQQNILESIRSALPKSSIQKQMETPTTFVPKTSSQLLREPSILDELTNHKSSYPSYGYRNGRFGKYIKPSG